MEAEPDITLVGIDRDTEALQLAETHLIHSDSLHLVHDNFAHMREILSGLGIDEVSGVILDIGVSSLQIDSSNRGFSFRREAPLDMRMDSTQQLTAYDIVNTASSRELVKILRSYGEQRFAARIVRTILAARESDPIRTTIQLAELVTDAIPARFQSHRIHPATKTFQAIRIAVNKELDDLRDGLEAAFHCLGVGGTMVVISFHSLEDRIVKKFFAYKALSCTCPPDFPECFCNKEVEATILTRKPVIASANEVENNPRARSAKLRAATKVM